MGLLGARQVLGLAHAWPWLHPPPLPFQVFGSGAQTFIRIQTSVTSCPKTTRDKLTHTSSPYSVALRMHSVGNRRHWKWKLISSLHLRTILGERQCREQKAVKVETHLQFTPQDNFGWETRKQGMLCIEWMSRPWHTHDKYASINATSLASADPGCKWVNSGGWAGNYTLSFRLKFSHLDPSGSAGLGCLGVEQDSLIWGDATTCFA